MVSTHISRGYAKELRILRERLLLMAGRVESMIPASVRSVVEQNQDLARKIIQQDHAVNRDEMDVDELCLLLLARRQPLGSDLRFITRSLKMVTDLERIGDLAVNIAERALSLHGTLPAITYKVLPELAEKTQFMLRNAIDSFVSEDVDLANEVLSQDDAVDALYFSFNQAVLQQMREGKVPIETGLHVTSVAKFLERIADHSTNIAEQVIFLVKGRDVRHKESTEPASF